MSNQHYEIDELEMFDFVKNIGLASCEIAKRYAGEFGKTRDLVAWGGSIHFAKIGANVMLWLQTHND